MKNIIIKLKQAMKFLLLVSVVGIGLGQPVFAQQSSSGSNSMPAVPQPPGSPGYPFGWPGGTVQPVLDGTSYVYMPQYFPYFANYLYTLAYELQWFYEQAQKDLTGPGPYNESITITANAANLAGATALATATQKASVDNMTQTFTMVGPNMNGIRASGMGINGTDITQDNTVDNSPFVFDTIYSPVYYSSSQASLAQNALQFISGTYLPLNVPSLSTNPNTRANQLQLPDVQTYFLKLRSYSAGASVAISNLNYILQERTVQKGLGTQAGMTTLPTDAAGSQPIADASPLQVQQFMVQRRINNSTWYTKMNSSTALDVSRETLFVLAEIQAQLYQLHLDNERMMATASVGVLGLGAAAKSTLQTQANSVAQQIASNGGSQ